MNGNIVNLGTVVNGSKELLTLLAQARATHLYVTGATGTGKFKFLEFLIRQDIIGWRNSKGGSGCLLSRGSCAYRAT